MSYLRLRHSTKPLSRPNAGKAIERISAELRALLASPPSDVEPGAVERANWHVDVAMRAVADVWRKP